MTALASALRWGIVVQARNGFYWASAFVVLVIGGLLAMVPASARTDVALWVPAILTVNLQITTFFFVAGLLLLERDEGTLAALAVSPLSPGTYLVSHMITLTALALVETVLLIWVVFGLAGPWSYLLAGTAALGVIYTGLGAVAGARYPTVNAMLLPAAVFVTLLLLPLLAHFGFAPRVLFLLHPIEPVLTLMRAGYAAATAHDLAYGVVGSIVWSGVAYGLGRNHLNRLMHDIAASGSK